MVGIYFLFQSAFIAVARLTNGWTACSNKISVSIRFHRGGPSHTEQWRSKPLLPVTVSIRFHRGGPSHKLEVQYLVNHQGFNPLSSRWPVSPHHLQPPRPSQIVSIRFHRGGPSHTSKIPAVSGSGIVSIRFHRGGPSHTKRAWLRYSDPVEFQSAFIAVARLTYRKLLTTDKITFQSAFIAVVRLTSRT